MCVGASKGYRGAIGPADGGNLGRSGRAPGPDGHSRGKTQQGGGGG